MESIECKRQPKQSPLHAPLPVDGRKFGADEKLFG